MSNRIKRQRRRLYEQNPYCHWCQRKLQLIEKPGGKLPDDAATIDHLRSRYDPLRQVPATRNECRRVLACFRCNFERGRKEILENHNLQVNKSGSIEIYNRTYLERKKYLKELEQRIEKYGIFGLMSVMGKRN